MIESRGWRPSGTACPGARQPHHLRMRDVIVIWALIAVVSGLVWLTIRGY